MSFSDFNLLPELNKAIEKLGYTEPTDIQAEALPILLGDDVDFVGQAQTGTGKTAAFVLPLLQKLDPNNKNIQALVLAPTRELANQVCQEVEKLGEFSRVKSYSVFGGICYDRQIRGIRKTKPQIIVGTPGRLIDLMNQGVLNFSQAKYLVLDEADEMLNMGFFDDVQKIVGNFSAERSMWMFSATMPTPIMNLIKKDFTDPKVVKVTKKTLSNADVTQTYYAVRAKDKETALCRLIDINVDMYGIVFCNTKKDTWELTDSLLAKGYKVDSLHGDMGQLQRDRSMARFKAGKSRLMICTDVAARGIDVNNLTHVVNYGLPRDMESFVHRIGRTGRAGLKGNAVSLIDPRERGYLRRLERFTKQQMIEGKLPTINEIKSGILRRELEKTTSLVEAILEKGEDFAIDSIYKEFADHYEVLSKEEFMKVMFSWRFNKEFKLLTEVTTAKATDRDSRGGGRDSRGGGRDSRGGGRDSRGGGRDSRGGGRDSRGGGRDSRGGGRDSRGGGRDSRDGGRDSRDGQTRDRNNFNSYSDPNNIMFTIEAGKKDGVRLQSLLKGIAGKTGVKTGDIHNVEMGGNSSTFEVSPRIEKKLRDVNLTLGNKDVTIRSKSKK